MKKIFTLLAVVMMATMGSFAVDVNLVANDHITHAADGLSDTINLRGIEPQGKQSNYTILFDDFHLHFIGTNTTGHCSIIDTAVTVYAFTTVTFKSYNKNLSTIKMIGSTAKNGQSLQITRGNGTIAPYSTNKGGKWDYNDPLYMVTAIDTNEVAIYFLKNTQLEGLVIEYGAALANSETPTMAGGLPAEDCDPTNAISFIGLENKEVQSTTYGDIQDATIGDLNLQWRGAQYDTEIKVYADQRITFTHATHKISKMVFIGSFNKNGQCISTTAGRVKEHCGALVESDDYTHPLFVVEQVNSKIVTLTVSKNTSLWGVVLELGEEDAAAPVYVGINPLGYDTLSCVEAVAAAQELRPGYSISGKAVYGYVINPTELNEYGFQHFWMDDDANGTGTFHAYSTKPGIPVHEGDYVLVRGGLTNYIKADGTTESQSSISSLVDIISFATPQDTLSASAARALAASYDDTQSSDRVMIKGYVVGGEDFSIPYGSQRFQIADAMGASVSLDVYMAKPETPLHWGDLVLVMGNLVNYKGNTPQVNRDAQVKILAAADVTGVEAVVETPDYRIENGVIKLQEAAMVQVLDVTGKTVYCAFTSEINNIPAGLYIMRVNDKACKLYLR